MADQTKPQDQEPKPQAAESAEDAELNTEELEDASGGSINSGCINNSCANP